MADSNPHPKKPVKSCTQCKTRMSTKEFDNHLLCISCRGIDCNVDNRCSVCIDWSHDRITQYTQHQAALLRKRQSKERCRTDASISSKHSDDHGKIESLSGSEARCDLSDDLASSASGLSIQGVEKLVGDKLASFESKISGNITAELDTKLVTFGDNILELINE